jgi:hypothetical protein
MEENKILIGDVGLYKVATGEDFSKAEKPGMFDLKVSFLPLVCLFCFSLPSFRLSRVKFG